VCCGNCPEWYRVTEYTFQNQTRSDCINSLVYGINDSTLIQRNRRIYYTTFFAVGYAVPLVIICVLYVLLVLRIRGHGRVGGDLGEVRGTSPKAAATRRRVMKMVTAVIVTFALCWLPSHVAFLIEAFADIHEDYRIEMVAFQIAATCLAYANSCMNPVIYAFLSENFRQSFRELSGALCSNLEFESFRELFQIGGSRGERSQMSVVRRSTKSEGRNKRAGRSAGAVHDGNLGVGGVVHDGNPWVPMTTMNNLSAPRAELTVAPTTTCFETTS